MAKGGGVMPRGRGVDARFLQPHFSAVDGPLRYSSHAEMA